MHFGLALSTGHESLGEYLDIDFREPECDALDLDALPGLLTPLLPEGLTVQAAAPITTSETSLQQAVTSCEWEIDAARASTSSRAAVAIASLLAAPEIVVTRQRKGNDVTDDIRPYILQLAVIGPVPGVLSPEGTRVITPGGHPPVRRAGHPAAGSPLDRAPGRPRPRGRRRTSTQDPPMDHARRRPSRTASCPQATVRTARRGRRTPRRVRHEKGTSP